MNNFRDDSVGSDVGHTKVACDEKLQNELSKLLSCVNDVYENRHLFAADLHIQQIIGNAREQAERAHITSLAVISPRAVSLQATALPAATHGDNVSSSPQEGGQPLLTRREHEALILIRDGYTNNRAAVQMSISPRTFECYRAEAKRKLGARNTAELVLKALKLSQV